MVTGLPARLYVDLEETRQPKTDSVSISISDLIYLTEQTVSLMGQTNNNILSSPSKYSL